MATESYSNINSVYTISPNTFKKRSSTLAEYLTEPRGQIFFDARPWKTERITNEAKALQLLAERTKIPIPQLIRYGQKNDGSMFLEMSRVDGVDLLSVASECRKPRGVRHNNGGACNKCLEIAQANAMHFIQTVLLIELAKLRSNATGLDGFVIPPPWVVESVDTRPHWEVKTSLDEEFVFIHGDLNPGNLIMDPDTLTVKSVVDWEHSGYFPPGFQR